MTVVAVANTTAGSVKAVLLHVPCAVHAPAPLATSFELEVEMELPVAYNAAVS